jgi:hypothetical protein
VVEVAKAVTKKRAKVITRNTSKASRPRGERARKIAEWLKDNFQAESIYFYRLAGLTGFLVVFGLVMVLS